MKQGIALFVFVLGWTSTALPAAPGTLTTLSAIHALSNAEAARSIPVSFEATVTYVRAYEKLLFVQDEGLAIYVSSAPDDRLLAGDRVLIQGTTKPSFHPIVSGTLVTVLHHGEIPTPIPSGFDDLIRAQRDCQLVTVRGVVRAADLVVSRPKPTRNARIQIAADGGQIELNLDSDDILALKKLLDSEVEVTGVEAGRFDGKMQQTGVELHVSSLADIKVIQRPSILPWSLPATQFGDILAAYHLLDLSHRVRVRGTITYYQPGSAVVLQDGVRSLWVATHTREPLQVGDQAEATGFPETRDRFLTLVDADVRDTQVYAAVTPRPSSWRELGFWSSNSPDGHQYDLVSIEGQVITEVREAARDEYVLAADGKLFTATLRHAPSGSELPAGMQIPLGSRVRVTGICMVVDVNPFKPGEEVPFDILLRSMSDITVVAGPPLLNVRNLIIVVGLLLFLVMVGGARGWILERRVRRQTAVLATRVEAEAALERHISLLEQRRSRILEDINSSRPLDETIENISELLSFKLNGAPCWCEIIDGPTQVDRIAKQEGMRILREEIPGRSGPPLGAIYAALDPLLLPSANEAESLIQSAALASLAVESYRIYSDLLHRSEFDLLTDLNNRFSLDKHLDAQIDVARRSAPTFGLIYIDLDLFKQINDQHGHKIGDLYLQQVSARMKSRLRPFDTLARLGGDEFAVLVPVAQSRTEVEVVAERLECCFDEPFTVEGIQLQGAASIGIAFYPIDGATKDNLLNAADAAMYAAKQSKRKRTQRTVEPRSAELVEERRT
jgi:diguanylate cyclase (GGDEF)-like protein